MSKRLRPGSVLTLSIGSIVLSVALPIAISMAAGAGCERPTRREQGAETQAGSRAEVDPPSVLLGEAELICNIDTKKNGEQKLVLRSGGGLEFDAVVSPIVDGIVRVKAPAQGGGYQFTSHLAQPGRGKLSGVGEVTLESLDTKVSVEMKRYDQPGGPGTAFSFQASDMSERGIYIEFAGKARAENGDRYAFRVNLGAAKGGSGKVTPATPDYNTHIQSKMVIIQAPVATTVSAVTRIQRVSPSAP